DFVELRIKNPNEPDVRKWNVLEFGEPEILKQSALAKFSLISAHLDKRRKEIAIKKSRLDIFAEAIFAGLNIGGGLAPVHFPLGEATRLGYNSLVTPWFIPPVPSVKQMRELFQLMTAKDKHPELRTKPGRFLDEADYQKLQEAAKSVTDAEVVDFLQRTTDDDLQGMLRVAKMQRIDAHLSNLLSLVADAGKVSGWTDQPGWQRDVFNSIYFSVTGEISIKNIIAVLVGGEVATPRSGASLYDLAHGNGPAAAWLQYLNVTVDIRAVINTVARLSHRSLADKELKKPFPYAPRMSDVSAYEIRIFGFPLLIFHKRGLMKEDYASFQNDYAYGLIGATIVEHFHTREDMDAEIRAGRMIPLGYVRVLNGKGEWKETNLAVFAHKIPSGKHRGKTAVIIYGLKAYAEHSQFIERERLRFQQFEHALQEGGVIEQLVEAENRQELSAHEFEPKLIVGRDAAEEVYAPLLGGLLELRRHALRQSWGLPLVAGEQEEFEKLQRDLSAKGIRADDPADHPLVGVDRFNSTFVYQKFVEGKWRNVKMTSLPGLDDIARELHKAEEGQRIEQIRRKAVASPEATEKDENGDPIRPRPGPSSSNETAPTAEDEDEERRTGTMNPGQQAGLDGVILLNSARLVNGHYELGPLLSNQAGQVIGVGVTNGPVAVEKIFQLIDQLPVTDRARLKFNNFAATVVELDADGDGKAERLFLTIEFPSDREIRRGWTNPLTGEREMLIYQKGLWRRAVSGRRIVELDYDQHNRETASRTYFN
ncbi:MAG TPA: hypothetical protein VFA77_15915, partial [Candidatus Eisenbacteria bacterium]|nr:hypothetical protein [Candidatus Eisenbacteria bacterium]